MVKVIIKGPLAKKLPAAYRKSISFKVSTIRELLWGLDQFGSFSADLDAFPHQFFVGKTLKTAHRLSAQEAAAVKLDEQEGVCVFIVPCVAGADPVTTTMVVTALVSAAISIGISLIMAVLFPPTQGGNDTRKSALYVNGMNTQQEGIPIPVAYGTDIFCGFNVIEADVEVLNTGGISGWMNPLSGALAVNASAGTGLYGSGANNYVDPAWDILKGLGLNVDGLGAKGGGKTIANNTFSNASMKILGAVSAGPIGGLVGNTVEEQESSIFIDKTALRDAASGKLSKQGFTWATRPGETGQSAVPITEAIATPYDASQELKKLTSAGIPTDIQKTFPNDINRSRFRFNMVLLQTSKKGNQSNATVVLGADFKRITDTSWTPYANWTFNGKTSTGAQREIQVIAPNWKTDEEWQVRIYRVTEDSTDDKIQNATTFNGWVEIIDKDLAYDGTADSPPTALFGASIDVSQFDSGSKPEIILRSAGRKVRVPHVVGSYWDGSWDTKVTANPVWIWFDMATDKLVGGGLSDTWFNRFELYEIAQFCDQLVNGRPRFTLNKQFTDSKELWQQLREVAQSFMAVAYWNGSSVSLVQDTPNATVSHYITNTMVEDGAFAYSFTDHIERFNEILVEYDDPTQFGAKGIAPWQDDAAITRARALNFPNDGKITNTIYKTGCTNAQEAYDWARLLGYASQREVRNVAFAAPIAGSTYFPGQIIEIDDMNVSGKEPVGRVARIIDADHIELDAPVTLEAFKSYTLRIVGETVRSISLPMLTVTTKSATINAPAHGAVVQAPVGLIELGTGPQPQRFRIIEVSEAGPAKYEVKAQQSIIGKWEEVEQHVPVPIPDWTNRDTSVRAPTNIVFTPHAAEDDITGSYTSLEISWTGLPTGALVREYVLEATMPDGGVSVELYRGANTGFTISRAPPGLYVVSVKTINMLGGSSEPLSGSYVLSTGDELVFPPVFIGFD
uniref:Phage-related protein tail component-like protein n=1 Tax=Caulobacter sp. (strain K31) TaxID=366602 RepID=B0T644_CAUSK